MYHVQPTTMPDAKSVGGRLFGWWRAVIWGAAHLARHQVVTSGATLWSSYL